jgi:RNA-binding protein YhbY
MKMNRWSKSGVLEKIFKALKEEDVIKVKIESICIDTTSVKVHPDGNGVLKKTENKV